MPYPSLDVDAVTALIAAVAHDIVMPKFTTLRDDEIVSKPTVGHLDDIVTVVDRDTEQALTSGLPALLPGSHVVGEESAHANPGVLAWLDGTEPVWIVDPLDGTSNFASGSTGFGIMVALAVDGAVRHAWVHLPALGQTFVAEAGGGAFMNGQRLIAPQAESAGPLKGAVFLRFMPDEVRERVRTATDRHYVAAPHSGAAAVEYTRIATGRRAFAVYYRLMPWDHGAPALILTESGGVVEHLDGQPYTVRSANQLTIVAGSPAIAARVRGWLS
jgi:fructose-1,6-bisphosphatase/inositol monophosphatase family enzyme